MFKYMTDREFLKRLFQIPRNFNIPLQLNSKSLKILKKLITNLSVIQDPDKNILYGEGLGILSQSSNFNIIPLEIRQWKDQTKLFYQLYKFKLISGRNIKLVIIHDMPFNDINHFNEVYNKVHLWLTFLDKISPIKCSKTLSIYLFLSNHSKVLPKLYKDEIDTINANSAFTFSCKENNEIFIFRREEFFKVFIHESFHSFGLDFSSLEQNHANSILKSCFQGLDKHVDYRIYESYCEIWAEIINIVFKVSNKYDALIKISEHIFYEKLWSIFQCSKILNHYGIKYIDLIMKGNQYTESKTSVFSYYILKSIGMFNINDFFKLCDENNNNLFDFTQNQEIVKKYCYFLCDRSKKTGFISKINRIYYIYKTIHISKKELHHFKSLRMSFYG
jgi:hypothetical protein